jgi:predicted transcriptional regulator
VVVIDPDLADSVSPPSTIRTDRPRACEIARLTGVPAGSLHRELKLLASAGLLERSTGSLRRTRPTLLKFRGC